jgi:hypothetical protein
MVTHKEAASKGGITPMMTLIVYIAPVFVLCALIHMGLMNENFRTARAKGMLFIAFLCCFAIYTAIDAVVYFFRFLDIRAAPVEAVYYALTTPAPFVIAIICAVLAPGFAKRVFARFGPAKNAATTGQCNNIVVLGKEKRRRRMRSRIGALRRSSTVEVWLPALYEAYVPLLVIIFSVLEIKLTILDSFNDWIITDYVFFGVFALLTFTASAMLLGILVSVLSEEFEEEFS